MTQNIDSRKLKLIEKITALSSEVALEKLEQYLAISEEEKATMLQPVRDHITVEELRKEQNYKGIDRAKFEALVDKLDIQESLEELLSMLN